VWRNADIACGKKRQRAFVRHHARHKDAFRKTTSGDLSGHFVVEEPAAHENPARVRSIGCDSFDQIGQKTDAVPKTEASTKPTVGASGCPSWRAARAEATEGRRR
jgi:hypothetical protein